MAASNQRNKRGPLLIPLLFAASIWFHLAVAQTAVSNIQTWHSIVADGSIPLTVLTPGNITKERAAPLIIYLENLVASRMGTEGDDSIVKDFLSLGYVVAKLDYDHHPRARVPFLNRDLGKVRDEIRARQFLPDYKFDNAHIYIVPSGSRLARDIVYYRDTNRILALDVIYPSKPAHPVGAVLEFSCDNQDRMGNTSLSICSDTILEAEASEGIAVAMADHPVAPPYKGLDPMPDCAFKIRAAVRTLRAEGANLGLNGKIVPVGFSRGSGMALMLVTTEGRAEFDGKGERQGINSSIQGAVVMSGRFTYLDLLTNDHMLPRYSEAWGPRETSLEVWRRHSALDYLDHKTLPLFLTINCTESPDALHQMTVLRKRLAALGTDETFMLDPEPRGHKVTLVPDILKSMNDYLKQRLN
jgi:hypothetical protein